MKRILKYQLEEAWQQTFDLPVGAEFLAVGTQGPEPGSYENWQLAHRVYAWVLVETLETLTRRINVFCVGTGEQFDLPGAYIGTVQTPLGLVWHFFQASA